MHISDGLLPPEVLIGGYVVAVGGAMVSLWRLPDRQIPAMAVMTSTFFMASLLPIPIGITSVHFLLHGLVGAVIGWRAMLPIVVGLTLQALLFGYGGVTTIGVNSTVMGVPAMLAGAAMRLAPLDRGRLAAGMAGFAVGSGALLLSLGFFLTIGLMAGEGFFVAMKVFVIAHLILAVIEGAVTAAAVGYLSDVKPELLRHKALDPPCSHAVSVVEPPGSRGARA